MTLDAKKRAEFGDFQTPLVLAQEVCRRLRFLNLNPEVIIEPTCGLGAFVHAGASTYQSAIIHGFELNASYLSTLQKELDEKPYKERVFLHEADFFQTDWTEVLSQHQGKEVLFLGNLPWVTSSALGSMGSTNLPVKSNFLKFKGLDAVTGKANFDISEWMLLRLLSATATQAVSMAMLVKTATARKVIAFANQNKMENTSSIHLIDAKAHFNASVDACLLLMQTTGRQTEQENDYKIFSSMNEVAGKIVGQRQGLSVADLNAFTKHQDMLGVSSQKWRSGVKHDASSVMELTEKDGVFWNNLGEQVDIEDTLVYPLMKGSDVANNAWRNKFVVVTQKNTSDDTSYIEELAPKTWAYLQKHKDVLDDRTSVIYKKNAPFALFGIGPYAFRPYRIAICGLYKKLAFRLIEPRNGKPVMFDDTVYYVSFDTKEEAQKAFDAITSHDAQEFYASLIHWDEKRPIKASLLNAVCWEKAA